MFCHKCGQADQSPETYCRQCGTFIRDPDQQIKKRATPEDHIKANSVLSLMTATVSLILAVSMNVFVLGEGSHWLLYLIMGFLFAITAWQVQTFVRMRMLATQIDRLRPTPPETQNKQPALSQVGQVNKRQIESADLSDLVPPSVTENTTKDLAGSKRPST